MYLSRLEKEILSLDEKYLILILQRGKEMLYICDDPYIVIKKKLTKGQRW